VIPLRFGSNLEKIAANIKARNAVSLADVFGAATAISMNGVLLTGADEEFERVEALKLERVSFNWTKSSMPKIGRKTMESRYS